jgi:hypothetical protein
LCATRRMGPFSSAAKPESPHRAESTTMKTIAEYREDALKFERLAADEQNPELKAQFEKQAVTYRKLASKRERALGLPPPPLKGH